MNRSIVRAATKLTRAPRPFQICSKYSKLTNPPSDSPPKSLAKHEKIPIPVHRVSYEYPPLPSKKHVPKESSPWKRHVPLLFGLAGVAWAFYAYNYIFSESGGEQTLLAPKKFTPFFITHKEKVADDLMLIEITPKWAQHLELLQAGGGLWNGKKLWSVEIKHPEIQIARKYTPLPLYFMQCSSGPPLLRLLGSSPEEGRLVFLIKRYADGEMSRYLFDLPVGSQVELRGPHIEHQFKYRQVDMAPPRQTMLDVPTRMEPDNLTDPKPDNIAFFGAGTGIAPAFQMLFSPNPPRGFTDVYYSVRSRKDIPFERFMLFLEKTGRAKFHVFADDENQQLEQVPAPVPKQPSRSNGDVDVVQARYKNPIQQHRDPKWNPYVSGVAQAIVCGPPGYVQHIGGFPGYSNELPLGGILKDVGWDDTNAKRLSDY